METKAQKKHGLYLEKLSFVLRRRKMGVLDLEKKSGVSDATIYRYIAGNHGNPRPSIIAKLSSALNVPQDYWTYPDLEVRSRVPADAGLVGHKSTRTLEQFSSTVTESINVLSKRIESLESSVNAERTKYERLRDRYVDTLEKLANKHLSS